MIKDGEDNIPIIDGTIHIVGQKIFETKNKSEIRLLSIIIETIEEMPGISRESILEFLKNILESKND
jgi:hypothetical protein